MADFHRLVDSTGLDYYFIGWTTDGDLPSTYDLINDPSSVTPPGSGVAAPADLGPKSGGANDGTYLSAGDEQANAYNTNRGNIALAANCDKLDNYLHRSIAMPSRSVNHVSAGETGIAQGGWVYVGSGSNTQEERNKLISILDEDDNEIIDPSTGDTIVASDILDSFGGSSVVGNTWENAVYITYNHPVPNGTTYRIYFGVRGSLAEMPEDAFVSIKIRAAEEVGGDIERVLRDLHAVTGQAWDDPWDSTIEALASFGLNEKYRRQTLKATSYNPDTAGDGAVVLRDGQAITVLNSGFAFDQTPANQDSAAGPDPFLALFRSEMNQSVPYAASFNADYSGDIGYLFIGQFRHTVNDSNEYTHFGRPAAGLAVYSPTDIRGSSIAGQVPYTRIKKGASALLHAAGNNEYEITVIEASNYFMNGSSETAIQLFRDVILVTFSDNSQQAYVISSINTQWVARLKTLGQATPDFDDDEAVTIQWFQYVYSAGGSSYLPILGVSAPPALSSGAVGELVSPIELKYRRLTDEVLRIGFHDLGGNIDERIGLYANGTIDAGSGYLIHASTSRSRSWTNLADASKSFTVNPGSTTPDTDTGEGYELLTIRCNTASAQTLTFTSSSLAVGTRVKIIIGNALGNAINVTWTGTRTWVFSGNDDDGPQSAGETFKWEGIVGNQADGSIVIFMTRTDYQ